jgi:hypothetical protein
MRRESRVVNQRRVFNTICQLLTFPADLNVIEYVGQLAPGYPLESLFTACVLPTERALSDLNCAKQAVTIADFECYCSASFGNVPSF